MSAIALLAYLLDEAFEERGLEQCGESQSLMGNLRTVPPGLWRS